jgi:hypothetical protein
LTLAALLTALAALRWRALTLALSTLLTLALSALLTLALTA